MYAYIKIAKPRRGEGKKMGGANGCNTQIYWNNNF